MFRLIILIVVVVGIVMLLRKSSRNQNGVRNKTLGDQEQPIVITPKDEWTVISAKGQTPPTQPAQRFGMFLMIAGILVVLLGVGEADGDDSVLVTAIVVGVLCVIVGALFWSAGKNKNRLVMSQDGPFAVKSDSIRTPNGNVIPSASVYRISIKNVMTDEIVGASDAPIPLSGVTLSGSAIAVGVASAMKWRRMMERIGNTVIVEHQGMSTMLASALTSEQAFAVLRETTARLDGFH